MFWSSTSASPASRVATQLPAEPAPDGSSLRKRSVVIVGAGFSGLCAAIKLNELGVGSITVLERSDQIGGTWQANRYPGIAVDTSILLYSLSFEPNPGWSRLYAGGAELRNYLMGVAKKHGLLDLIRFNTWVTEMRWDTGSQQWQVSTGTGDTYTADVLVSGTGPLSTPSTPNIPGLDNFRGEVLHSADWDESFDARGKRIAQIGTGATAAQIVPELAKHAAHLTVYQRSAAWVLPRNDRKIGRLEGALYKYVPLTLKYRRWRSFWSNDRVALGFERKDKVLGQQERLALEFLERSIPDPVLRKQLTPDYSIGCKRRVMSDDFYPALCRDNVDLVDGALERVTPTGVVGKDGVERPVDAIVFSTGFAVADFMPMKVFGVDGREIHEEWKETAQSYLGISVAGFPNLFLIGGPHTAIGAGSFAFMVEAAVRYVVGAVKYLQDNEVSSIDLKPEVQRKFYWSMQSRLSSSVYGSGCVGWYQRPNGMIDTLWPGLNAEYWWRTRVFRPERYTVTDAEGQPLRPHVPARLHSSLDG